MKYLTPFNGLPLHDKYFNHFFVQPSFKDFSAEFTANFTDDSLMQFYIIAISTSGSIPTSRRGSGLILIKVKL